MLFSKAAGPGHGIVRQANSVCCCLLGLCTVFGGINMPDFRMDGRFMPEGKAATALGTMLMLEIGIMVGAFASGNAVTACSSFTCTGIVRRWGHGLGVFAWWSGESLQLGGTAG